MDFINTVKEYVPIPVIVAIVAVIMLVYTSIYIAQAIEDYLEERAGKQIAIFDHKKIWLSFGWSVVVAVTLGAAGFIAWKELPFYTLVVLGGSTFMYEAFLKKLGMKNDDKKDIGNS
ncbi:MAG: hypothetical protein J6P07_05915 [Spirochaetaceae bacterium]|nr:hypothetical protein [Spirochaetaceae bacterium]MBO7731538.1 hypothetical protein [Methanobrevibacter sp.]